MEILAYVIVAAGAYLLGSLPTGYLVALSQGIDIRSVGSGNIGATNAFRVLGKGPGAFVLLVDMVKGWVAVAFAGIGGPLLAGTPDGQQAQVSEFFQIIGGLSVILGHNYTCWLKFKGGKGIATSAGVVLALMPKAMCLGLGAFLVTFAASRYVSLSSIMAAVVLPVATWWFGYSRWILATAALMSAMAIYKHKANIQRLFAGTENRIGAKKTGQETPS